jgi:stage V sporulation protein SpoVS
MKTVVLSRLFFSFILFYQSPFKTAAQSISGVINSYYRVTAINTVTNKLTLNTVAGLTVNTKVLLIQMKGADINNSNTASFGDINAINNAGNYEINYICAIAGNEVLLSLQLARSYTVGAGVQLVTMPVYNSVTVSGTITGQPWDASTGTGGVIALEAQTIFLNSNIDATGLGFAGGVLQNYSTPGYDCTPAITVSDYALPLMPPASPQYVSAAPKGEGIAAFITGMEYARGKQANGGGGANNHNSGGGGGSNYGAGGMGGIRSLQQFWLCQGPGVGLGGLSLSTRGYSVANNRMFMGGGGGAGHENNSVGMPGGAGGGIVYIKALSIVGAGARIIADGARPYNPALVTDPYSAGGDGGGGGGGGGTIILNVNSVSGNIQASAVGGRGSDAGRTGNSSDCPGTGGGGGGGVVWMKGGAPIANVTSVVTGGANGIGSPLSPNTNCRNLTTNATAGANGATLTGFVASESTQPPICEPLPLNELKSFTGKSTPAGNILQWQMHSVENIVGFEVQRTVDRVQYQTIAYRDNSGQLSYEATDENPAAETNYYRLKVIRANNQVDYSPVITITTHNAAQFQWFSMQPNPASQQVTVRLFVKQNTEAKITLYQSTGQQLRKKPLHLSPGQNTLSIPLQSLANGVYWMAIEAQGVRLIKTFIKK